MNDWIGTSGVSLKLSVSVSVSVSVIDRGPRTRGLDLGWILVEFGCARQ